MSLRNTQFFKIWWMLLVNCVRHAHLKFKLQRGVAGLIMEPCSSKFCKKVNLSKTIKWYFYDFLTSSTSKLRKTSGSLPSRFWVILAPIHTPLVATRPQDKYTSLSRHANSLSVIITHFKTRNYLLSPHLLIKKFQKLSIVS